MVWLRSNCRSLAYLALFALFAQMAVSFGHIHRDDLGLPPVAPVHQVHFSAMSGPLGPTDDGQQPAPDQYCPICASMALTATAIPSLPPVLLVPSDFQRIWVPQAQARDVPQTMAHLFQARAPPIA